jgi:dnd system-associated protein 4
MIASINQKNLFTGSHVIRWPEKYKVVVDYLINGIEANTNENSLFELNVHVISFAAAVGVRINRRASISGEKLLEIHTDTFINKDLGIWIFLIALMSDLENPNINLLRDNDTESEAVKIFQEYVCSGLNYLNEKFLDESIHTPYFFIQKILDDLNNNNNDDNASENNINDIVPEIW